MAKEKEIQGMANILISVLGRETVDKFIEDENGLERVETYLLYEVAEKIYNAGYGNKKQAVKEFAEKVKEWLNGCNVYFYNGVEEGIWNSEEAKQEIDRFFKELYGED